MPKNRVQFQPRQSLRDFLMRYGTDDQCAQALFQARWPQGFRGPRCGYHKHCQLRRRKTLQCIRCKQQTSLIAGTLFEDSKLGLSIWYLAMYLLTQSKNGISAMDLKRQLGVSYNSAWMVKHKLMQAMREREDSQPLCGIVELDDAYLGGESSGGKRGRGAARKTPFLAAAQVSAERRPERLRLNPVSGFRRRAVEAWARQQLQPGTVVRSPGLSWVNTLLGNVKRASDGTYHACSSRYAGRYLAEFAYPFQPTLSVGRSRAASRLRRRAHSSAALSAPNSGWNCWVIRYPIDRLCPRLDSQHVFRTASSVETDDSTPFAVLPRDGTWSS